MDILWHPEEGSCAWCGEVHGNVRGHSDEKRYALMCFPCWDAQQDGCILSSGEWEEDTAYVFQSPSPAQRHPVGTAQGAFPN